MQLTWYGTAALILREGDAAIAFDPFCGIPVHGLSQPERELPYEEELRSVKDVFITHGQFDHIVHIPRIYKDVPLNLRCTHAPRETLIRNGVRSECIREICPGVSEKAGPFTVTV